MRYSAPRGTRDLFDQEARAFSALEGAAARAFARYGYEEIRTPVLESEELFSRAVGDTTDIVEKEMYVLTDRGGRKLALRPEGTAGVVRAYLEHNWDKTGGLKKLFYRGTMYRAERPQAGRYREFSQIGAEYFGNGSPTADAEILLLSRDILTEFGLSALEYKINNIGDATCRPVYRKRLTDYLNARRAELCEDCQRRIEKNPLRALDCKIDGPKLTDAPLIADDLCDDCRRHDAGLKTLLASVGFSYVVAPRLMRGLDYYSRTVFELTSRDLGAQDAVAAGGRYDALVKLLGGPDVPAVGFALGMDRVVNLKLQKDAGAAVSDGKQKKIYVALAGAQTAVPGFKILQELRGAGFSADIGAEDKSLKSQLRSADGWSADGVVIVGESELARGAVMLKDLKNHSQSEVQLSDVITVLRK